MTILERWPYQWGDHKPGSSVFHGFNDATRVIIPWRLGCQQELDKDKDVQDGESEFSRHTMMNESQMHTMTCLVVCWYQ